MYCLSCAVFAQTKWSFSSICSSLEEKEEAYFKYGIFHGILKKVLETLNLHKFLENICSLFLKCYVCISDLLHPSLLKMGNVDKEDREMIPGTYLVFTLKDMKDSFGVQFSTDGLEHILTYGGGMYVNPHHLETKSTFL